MQSLLISSSLIQRLHFHVWILIIIPSVLTNKINILCLPVTLLIIRYCYSWQYPVFPLYCQNLCPGPGVLSKSALLLAASSPFCHQTPPDFLSLPNYMTVVHQSHLPTCHLGLLLLCVWASHFFSPVPDWLLYFSISSHLLTPIPVQLRLLDGACVIYIQ